MSYLIVFLVSTFILKKITLDCNTLCHIPPQKADFLSFFSREHDNGQGKCKKIYFTGEHGKRGNMTKGITVIGSNKRVGIFSPWKDLQISYLNLIRKFIIQTIKAACIEFLEQQHKHFWRFLELKTGITFNEKQWSFFANKIYNGKNLKEEFMNSFLINNFQFNRNEKIHYLSY